MYTRRLFYDITTGTVLRSWHARGDFRLLEQQQEATLCSLANYACMEWTEPDAEIEAAFAPVDAEGKPRSVHVSVDVSGETPELVFSYEPIPEGGTGESEDMEAALALLGVTPKETEE